MLSEESTGCQVLIVVEGPDFTGKSSLVKYFADKIRDDYVELGMHPVCTYSRPGGTPECNVLREHIVNMGKDIDPVTRQAFAFAEETLFWETMHTKAPIVILDRYNPISGQVYGPPEFRQAWRMAATHNLARKPDMTLMLSSSYKTLCDRARSRGALNAMDLEFLEKMPKYLQRYQDLTVDQWYNTNCAPCSVTNDGDFESFAEITYELVRGVINERRSTIGF